MTFPLRARGLLLSVAGTLAAVALVAVPTARAQPFPQPPQPQPIQIPGGGTELFRALLDKEGIEPVRAADARAADADLIVVVLGNVFEWNPTSLQAVRDVLKAGGAALVASDSHILVYDANNPPNFNVNNSIGAFAGEGVEVDGRNPRDYHRRHDCPYTVPVSPDEVLPAGAKPGRVWDVFRGLTQVATNQPTYLTLAQFRGEYRYPLARLPKSSVGQHGTQFNRSSPLFAVGGDGPERWGVLGSGYSFLAVADSSVFINQMLMEPGTDNLELTLRTVEYLQGPDKSRKRCLFYENGRVIDRFDGLRDALAKPKPKLPPDAMPNLGPLFGKHQDKLVGFLDAKADELQERDVLHRSVVGPAGSERERNAAAAWAERVAVVLSIGIVFFLLRRMWSVRTPQDIPLPPHTGAGVASTGPPGVFDRRQKEMVRRNNVYEPVRHLMREFFASVGAPPNPGPRMPPLEITRAVRKPESLRQALRDMWRLAYGPPTPLTAQRWFELEPYFDRLKQAHADGKWYFVTDAAEGRGL